MGAVRRAALLALITVAAVALWPAAAHAEARRVHIREAPFPRVIHVAIRTSRPSGEPDPRGRIIWVKAVNFTEYVKDVLPNEWMPRWHPEALKAGAIAVKMFGWYHLLNPTTLDGYRFDVDNTVNFQTYREGRRYPATNRAVDETLRVAFVERTGHITPTYYRAGRPNDPNWQYRNANKMAQWGTQYWAERGRNHVQILQFYYEGKVLVPIPRF